MNRTIKFRGKVTDNVGDKKIWIYGDLLQGCELCDICEISDCESIDGSRYQVEPYSIGQFTGLHDKNGKEIYEGDIVSFRFKKDRAEWADLIGFIEYQTQYCAFKIVVYTSNGAYGIDDETIIEVIGNLYENSELLGGALSD